MSYIWLIIVILLAIIEFLTINLTTIWFIASGIVALIISFMIKNFVLQLAVFAILGIILLVTTRPILIKIIKPKDSKTNVDRIIGMKGVVTESISDTNPGEVKVDGKHWTAISSESLKVDDIVKILSIDGVKLKVKKWED